MINWNEELKLLSGEPVVMNEKPASLRTCVINALGAGFEDERQLDGEEKLKRFKLSMKLFNDENFCTNSSDVELMKKCVAKAYPAGLCGLIWIRLDPKLAE